MSAQKDKLVESLGLVEDAESFLTFVRALIADRETAAASKSSHPSDPFQVEWQNARIETYLEAAVAWADDSNFGLRQGLTSNPWSQFANFLYAGKIYE